MIKEAISGLAHFLYSGLKNDIEPVRLARVGYALIAGGCSIRGTFPNDDLSSYLIKAQRDDGGWSDVEETLWSLGYLNAFRRKHNNEICKGLKWLISMQLPSGAWGKSLRDQSRIPITALAACIIPDVISNAGLKWLADKWEVDLNGHTPLTYKGAYFLLANVYTDVGCDNQLINRTIEYLVKEQQENGGYSPWRGHPAGSDPWSTGVALWGLSRVRELVPRYTIERALSWLRENQLPNGLWPYHYLDDGTAMALIGISSVLPDLREY